MTPSYDFLRKFESITIGELKSIIFNQRPLFKLYGMAICLNLESLDSEILQIKITIFE